MSGLIHCEFKHIPSKKAAEQLASNIETFVCPNTFDKRGIRNCGENGNDSIKFTLTREEANKVRDQLAHVLSNENSPVWFNILSNPLDLLMRRSLATTSADIYQQGTTFYASCLFGSLRSYSQFYSHNSFDNKIVKLSFIPSRSIPDTLYIEFEDIRIVIPFVSIQRKNILVNKDNAENGIYVLLPLKYAPNVYRLEPIKGGDKSGKNLNTKSVRICADQQNVEFVTDIGQCSDLVLYFIPPKESVWMFLSYFLIDHPERYHINFSTFKISNWSTKKNQNQTPDPFNYRNASFQDRYALQMLMSLGFLFQDKWAQLTDQELNWNKWNIDERYTLCCYVVEQLCNDHGYDLRRTEKDYNETRKRIDSNMDEQAVLVGNKQRLKVAFCTLAPLNIIFHPLEVTTGSRALRNPQFGGPERFLLVHFRDEDNRRLHVSSSSIKHRLKNAMLNGIELLNRTFKYMGASTGQMKEMCFWFIDLPPNLKTMKDAHDLLGNFDKIKNISTYIARVGQYFSTTWPIGITLVKVANKSNIRSNDTAYYVYEENDIKRNDAKGIEYCFTDGIGKISWGLAGRVAQQMHIPLYSKEDIPSAYQIRVAGCKGIVAIDPNSTLNDYYISVRDSMMKFPSDDWNLEICEFARPMTLTLNNQVIRLLSDLGNSDDVFIAFQNRGFTQWEVPDDQQPRAIDIAVQKNASYSLSKDNLITNRIPIPPEDGRNLFGVADETGELKYGECFIQCSSLNAANNGQRKFRVITGPILVTKNPCLWPGDFRQLQAVRNRKLEECMRDVIVFPINGHRPHPNEIAGSDLDGDKYWVYWGDHLRIERNVEPLSYEAAKKTEVSLINQQIIVNHIVESFEAGVILGMIANTHTVVADKHEKHSFSEPCKKLAELFALAVDSPKTGKFVAIAEIRPFQAKYYESWPEFMRKTGKPTCNSNSILQKLFSKAVERYYQWHEKPKINPSPQKIRGINDATTMEIRDEAFKNWLDRNSYKEAMDRKKVQEKSVKEADNNESLDNSLLPISKKTTKRSTTATTDNSQSETKTLNNRLSKDTSNRLEIPVKPKLATNQKTKDIAEHQCGDKLGIHIHTSQHAEASKQIDITSSTPSVKRKVLPQSAKEPIQEIIELNGAQCNFLEFFGDKILSTIRNKPGIKDVKIKDGKLHLIGDSLVISNTEYYLKETLHEQYVTIPCNMKKYLQTKCQRPLLKRFSQKYSVGISFRQTSTNTSVDTIRVYNQNDNDRDENHSEDNDDDDDDDDAASESSNASSSTTTKPDNFRPNGICARKFKQVTLCSDSKELLSKATKELKNYSLNRQAWALSQDEITWILSQSRNEKPSPQKYNPIREQCFRIKNYLTSLTQSDTNSIVRIFINYTNGVWHVNVTGFQNHVKNAVPKIKNWLDDNVKAEIQLPISKVMAIFLRTKASSDIKKLEKTHCIKITIPFSSSSRKHKDDQQDDSDHGYLKLTGSTSRISLAQTHVEDFLENLFEKQKHFPCQTWDVSRNICSIICMRLQKFQDSPDCEAIGWIKTYATVERRETTSKITISIVGFNELAVDDVVEQCQDIVEGYTIWKPSGEDYRAMVNALLVKKIPSLDEFCRQWDAEIRLDRDTSTVTIPAQSKMIAEEIKEALLSLREEKKIQVERISEFIRIPLNIRRFFNQNIGSLLDEAKCQKIFLELKNPHGLTLHGPSEIIIEFKQKINLIINNIQRKITTYRIQLSSIESDFMRTNAYEPIKRIERETNTIIRDVNADKTHSSSNKSDDDTNPTITIMVNNRGQTIAVEKGDITKARNVDAILNAANGSLRHAGGVDKAIANAAGSALDEECKQIITENNGLPIPAGKAVKTTAGRLPFKCIIHAIGPQYMDGNQQERSLLFSCILECLKLAENEGCTSVALPAISDKTYGFPLADCTNIVVRAIKQFFADYPQSKMKKVILLDMDDTACNSIAREVSIDHNNAVLDNDDAIVDCELPPLTAEWCWQDDNYEQIYNDDDICQIENTFQEYLKNSSSSELTISVDNLASGTIIDYNIHFFPDVKTLIANNPNTLNSRLVCGFQMRKDTRFRRDLIRYPLVVVQQQRQNKTKPVSYRPKPLDSYDPQITIARESWDITGITKATLEQAQKAIRSAIDSATISESFSINLDQNLDDHRMVLSQIVAQQHIKIDFQQESSGQLSMTLKGFKTSVLDAKSQIDLYAEDILKTQVENDDELRIPKAWGDQKEGCNLVPISKNDPDFASIENRMKETLPNIKIDKIERIQNVRLWNHYAFRRRVLKKELRVMSNSQIELELFHGTRNTPTSTVYNGEYGLDMTFSSDGLWGIGIYFAKNASYSCGSYAYTLPNGKKQVFLAQVLTGDVYDCKSDTSLRRPPKKNEKASTLRYNSVSGDTGGSKVYIVYENRVVYPTYLITFIP
ncbi:unnamed protein product [Adineta steineri]|uniref:Poly [ADP-ribose] polymerase n=1 Tax=Adineta steineri TaxID=433720 RepID=A0A815CHW3_9BILA|nr:unnamed protein product [Adineta steineri]CAF1287500.1 unnamed protein product [Adineta steineri]